MRWSYFLYRGLFCSFCEQLLYTITFFDTQVQLNLNARHKEKGGWRPYVKLHIAQLTLKTRLIAWM